MKRRPRHHRAVVHVVYGFSNGEGSITLTLRKLPKSGKDMKDLSEYISKHPPGCKTPIIRSLTFLRWTK